MADYTAIEEITESIVNMFRKNMTPEPVDKEEYIGAAYPYEVGDLKLCIYLYSVVENNDTRTRNMRSIGSRTREYPPLILDLYYMVTAFSSADIKSRALDEQRILGRAFQVIHDTPTLNGSNLVGSLQEDEEEFVLELINLNRKEISDVWDFSDVNYKPSIVFRVRNVEIKSNRVKTSARVVERDIRIFDKTKSDLNE